MNREQFDRESEEISLVAKGNEIESQLSALQRYMEQKTGHLFHKYPQATEQMRDVVNSPAFRSSISAQMRSMASSDGYFTINGQVMRAQQATRHYNISALLGSALK